MLAQMNGHGAEAASRNENSRLLRAKVNLNCTATLKHTENRRSSTTPGAFDYAFYLDFRPCCIPDPHVPGCARRSPVELACRCAGQLHQGLSAAAQQSVDAKTAKDHCECGADKINAELSSAEIKELMTNQNADPALKTKAVTAISSCKVVKKK